MVSICILGEAMHTEFRAGDLHKHFRVNAAGRNRYAWTVQIYLATVLGIHSVASSALSRNHLNRGSQLYLLPVVGIRVA